VYPFEYRYGYLIRAQIGHALILLAHHLLLLTGALLCGRARDTITLSEIVACSPALQNLTGAYLLGP
jgi:hypothetical protein